MNLKFNVMSIIKEFQEKNGLVADGLIGKKTLLKMKEIFKISSDEELAHFIAQCDHESGGFTASIENLNYSADRLLVIFSKYFKSNASALAYHRQPIKIGNKVYANRMGNGDEASCDGYKYRGRGAIQLTFKDNYKAFASYVGDLSIIENPDLVATKYFFDSALFFFTRNKVWSLCKKVSNENILLVTRKINGGTNGLLDRQNKTKKYYNLIK